VELTLLRFDEQLVLQKPLENTFDMSFVVLLRSRKDQNIVQIYKNN